jgi:hypothetical protein
VSAKSMFSSLVVRLHNSPPSILCHSERRSLFAKFSLSCLRSLCFPDWLSGCIILRCVRIIPCLRERTLSSKCIHFLSSSGSNPQNSPALKNLICWCWRLKTLMPTVTYIYSAGLRASKLSTKIKADAW